MGLKGVDIQRGSIGTNALGNPDAVCALLASGVAIESSGTVIGLPLEKGVKLSCLKDAEAYGVTAEYDKTKSLSVYRHVSEFYRIAPAGSELWLMLYSGTMENAFASASKKLIAEAKGEIRVMAVANTPAENADEYLNGIPEDVFASIAAAQEFYDWTFNSFRPCQIVLEGRDFNAASATAALDLRAIEIEGQPLEAYKVSLCIAQDWNHADSLDDVRKRMADVGTMLGSLAKKRANENIGEVLGGNLEAKGKWIQAGLSNHKTIETFDDELEGLDTKGYIFAIAYAGMSGFYWSNDHTCTPIVKDEDGNMNENTISNGRVHDKAVRDLRSALLPNVKSTVPVDPATGKLPQAVVTYFETIGDNVFEKMIAQGLISAGKTTVDANSDLTTIPRELKVSFVIVPTGQIDEIKGTINLKSSL